MEEKNKEVREQLARFAAKQKEAKEREERIKLEEEKILLGMFKSLFLMKRWNLNIVKNYLQHKLALLCVWTKTNPGI